MDWTSLVICRRLFIFLRLASQVFISSILLFFFACENGQKIFSFQLQGPSTSIGYAHLIPNSRCLKVYPWPFRNVRGGKIMTFLSYADTVRTLHDTQKVLVLSMDRNKLSQLLTFIPLSSRLVERCDGAEHSSRNDALSVHLVCLYDRTN
jgi:hypothetical protein